MSSISGKYAGEMPNVNDCLRCLTAAAARTCCSTMTTMRGVAGWLAALAAAICAVTASAAAAIDGPPAQEPRAVPVWPETGSGWDGISWGDDSPTLARRFGGRAVTLAPPIEFGDSYVDVAL